MFAEELARYKDAHALVEVYTNPQNTSRFNVCTILAFDEEFFVMSTVSKYGRLDGYSLKKTEDIIRLSESSIYLKKMGALLRYYNEKPEPIALGEDLVYDFLEHCRASNRIVSIEVVDSDYIDSVGYIDALDYDRCTVSQVSEFGKGDGVSYILTKDVTSVTFGSEEETMLEILNSELFDERHSG